jgi:hypothetical protein
VAEPEDQVLMDQEYQEQSTLEEEVEVEVEHLV